MSRRLALAWVVSAVSLTTGCANRNTFRILPAENPRREDLGCVEPGKPKPIPEAQDPTIEPEGLEQPKGPDSTAPQASSGTDASVDAVPQNAPQGKQPPAVDPRDAPRPAKTRPEVSPEAKREATRALEAARADLAAGNTKAALRGFERAYSLHPGCHEIADGLVRLLKDLGLKRYSKRRVKEAKAHWQRVLEVRPSDAETLRYLKRAEALEHQLDKRSSPGA